MCNTMGKECEATLDGERVKVSYYYNGPMLVEMVSVRDEQIAAAPVTSGDRR